MYNKCKVIYAYKHIWMRVLIWYNLCHKHQVWIPSTQHYFLSQSASESSNAWHNDYWYKIVIWFIAALQSSCLLWCVLSAHISQKPHVQTAQNFVYMLTVAMAQFSSDNNGIQYVYPVLWRKSCFHYSHNKPYGKYQWHYQCQCYTEALITNFQHVHHALWPMLSYT